MSSRRRKISFEFVLMIVAIVFFTFQVGLLKFRGVPNLIVDDKENPILFSVTEKDWFGRKLNSLSALDYYGYPEGMPKLVIATYVSNHQPDIDKLCTLLKAIDHYVKGDVTGFPTPLLVFNEGMLSNFQLEMIVWSTTRPIAFPIADFGFPQGFDPSKESEEVNERIKSLYPQIVRFWLTDVWKHSAIDAFDIVMRIDFDTCFNLENTYLPNFEKHRMTYHAQYVGFDNSDSVKGLYNFTKTYMARAKVSPYYPLAWTLVTQAWNKNGELPLYQASLEVIHKLFMQHPHVSEFNEAITDHEPFGVFRYGWNDHAVRFLTTTLFTNSEHHMISSFDGFRNRVSCNADEQKGKQSDIQDLVQFEVIEIKNNVFEED